MIDRIREIVKHAYTTTVVYEDIAKDRGIQLDDILEGCITRLPVVDKARFVIKENGTLSSEYVIKAYREELINGRTSGSNGKYLNIYWDKNESIRSLLSLWLYRRKYYGIDSRDKMCFFYTSRNLGNTEQRIWTHRNQRGFSKNDLNMQELVRIYEDMKIFKPIWLNVQPSMAALLCKCIRKYNLTGLDSIRYVEFTGEMLSDSIRKEVESIFKCKTANQYGANEVNSIAYECPYGNMHIMNSNVYVEIVNENDELVDDQTEGYICVTSLTNKAMPFIRYKIGDRGYIRNITDCPCGNCNKILDVTAGRENDYAIDNKGEMVNSYVFVRAIDNMNIIFDGAIKQFQVEQKEIGIFVVRLVLDEDISIEMIEEKFLENLVQSSLADAYFQFEVYEELLPDDNTGKLRYFISNLGIVLNNK